MQYDVRARVDGKDCTAPSGFSVVDQEFPSPALTTNQAQALAATPLLAEPENPGPSAQPQQNASLSVSASSLTVSEGGSANFTASLSGAPTGDVTVSIASSDTSALKPAFSSALFTPAHTGPYTIPALGLTDTDTTNETATLTLTPSGGGVSAPATVSVPVTDAGPKTLNAPTLSLDTPSATWAAGTIEGDLNWTARAVKQCRIDRYELHYKKSSLNSWPSVSDTANANSGVHVIRLTSRYHGTDAIQASVVLGQGSQPKLDAVQYDVRARVDGADCTAPSGFSAVAQGSPRQAQPPPTNNDNTGEPPPTNNDNTGEPPPTPPGDGGSPSPSEPEPTPLQGSLENPAPGSAQSGIGLLSGWVVRGRAGGVRSQSGHGHSPDPGRRLRH